MSPTTRCCVPSRRSARYTSSAAPFIARIADSGYSTTLTPAPASCSTVKSGGAPNSVMLARTGTPTAAARLCQRARGPGDVDVEPRAGLGDDEDGQIRAGAAAGQVGDDRGARGGAEIRQPLRARRDAAAREIDRLEADALGHARGVRV